MREMLVANGMPAELIRVHPYSIDLSRFGPCARRAAESTRGASLRLHRHDQPAEGRPRADSGVPAASSNPDATLEIIGDSTAEPDYFRELYALAAGDDRIRFAGGIPNERIPERLARIDVQVVPSIWYENAPLTIYSAQAAGVPVVASDLGGMSEVVGDEENGLLFEPGDAADLTARSTG